MKVSTVLLATMMLAAASAQAHTHLSMSMPADKSVVTKAPNHVMLTFSGEARLTSLRLQKGSEAAQTLGPLPARAAKEVLVTVPALPPGKYMVSWRAAGDDNHIVVGKFSFTVAIPPAAGQSK